MRRVVTAVLAVTLLGALPVWSHHAAEGTVDAEIYEMIDAMVADTPHATWEPPVEIGVGVFEMELTTRTSKQFESLIEAGLLTNLAMLDGEVVITMTFNQRGGVNLKILQVKDV